MPRLLILDCEIAKVAGGVFEQRLTSSGYELAS